MTFAHPAVVAVTVVVVGLLLFALRALDRRRTADAPGTWEANNCSMRVWRIDTRANSVATKKALARMSMATATNLSRARPSIWVRG